MTPAALRFSSLSRWLRVTLLVLGHLWGPLLLLLPGFGLSAGELVASLILGALLSGSVSAPRMLRRRHGWWRALTLSSLAGAVLLVPVAVLAADGSVSSPDGRRIFASWVLFGLLLAPLVQAAIAPLRLVRAFFRVTRSLSGRLSQRLGLPSKRPPAGPSGRSRTTSAGSRPRPKVR